MLPFAFDRNSYIQTDYSPLDQEELLSRLLLLSLENQRLTALTSQQTSIKDQSFSFSPETNQTSELKVQL
jgi:hypothetical protein